MVPKGHRTAPQRTPKVTQWSPQGPKNEQKSIQKTQFSEPFSDFMAQDARRAPLRPHQGPKLSQINDFGMNC